MKKYFFLFAVFFALFFLGAEALAQGNFGLDNTAIQAGYETAGPAASEQGRIQMIVSVVLGFTAFIFFGLTLYGGIIWLTARGQEEKVSKAKSILEAAIIGLIIVAFSYAITNFVLKRITGADESGNISSCNFMAHNECYLIYNEADQEQCIADGGDIQSGPCVNN